GSFSRGRILFVRRLTTFLLVVAAAASWLTTGSGRLAAAGSGRPELQDLAVTGRKAAAALIRDAGLSLNASEIPRSVVRAVLVDVDADGDTDLVANIGSLDLGVWINDGQGRLTRTPGSTSPGTWIPQPPVPGLDAGVPGVVAAVPAGGAPLGPGHTRAGPPVAPRDRVAGVASLHSQSLS